MNRSQMEDSFCDLESHICRNWMYSVSWDLSFIDMYFFINSYLLCPDDKIPLYFPTPFLGTELVIFLQQVLNPSFYANDFSPA